MPRTVLTSSAGYFLSQMLVMLGGFISLPILTRLLSKEEYGVLSLVFATASILMLVGLFGFPQATVRFYAEQRQGGGGRLREFCSDMVAGVFGSSIVVALVAVLVVAWAGGGGDYARCMRLAAIVVIIRAAGAVVLQMYRAEDRVLGYMAAQVVARYATLGLVVLFLLVWRGTAYEVLLATVIGEGLVLAVCLVDLAARGVLGRPQLSWPRLALAARYGVPLSVGGSASFVLDYGDRFLIQRFLGFDAVASYAVPYDLAQNLAAGLFGPIRLAVIPVIFGLWASGGQEATVRFASQVFTYMVALAIPVAVLFALLSHDLVLLLASAKYAGSASLIPYLLPGVVLGEMNFLVASGLTIQKSTVTLSLIVLLGGLVNVVLNALLLPLLGLAGAAVATTICYVLVMAMTFSKGRHTLPLRLHYAVIGKALLATGLMSLLLLGLGPLAAARAFDLAARAALGAAVVAGCMFALDRNIRQLSWLRPQETART
jgi:O-antigen/teichoic acid export membrane protein